MQKNPDPANFMAKIKGTLYFLTFFLFICMVSMPFLTFRTLVHLLVASCIFHFQCMVRVPRDAVVKCLTRNPGFLGLSRTGSSEFFSWECPWARHFRAQPSTGETQESMNNVSCRRDVTEILLKAA